MNDNDFFEGWDDFLTSINKYSSNSYIYKQSSFKDFDVKYYGTATDLYESVFEKYKRTKLETISSDLISYLKSHSEFGEYIDFHKFSNDNFSYRTPEDSVRITIITKRNNIDVIGDIVITADNIYFKVNSDLYLAYRSEFNGSVEDMVLPIKDMYDKLDEIVSVLDNLLTVSAFLNEENGV